MLKSLLIENYALIEKLDIQFDEGLTIITGETGAGKSILLGALGLILGQRADTTVLFDKERKCIIEGSFHIAQLSLQELFKTHELDYEDYAIFRREITPQGKSRAFINDTPVNLQVMKDFAEKLIDVHSQHQNLVIGQSAFQFNVLDAFAGVMDDVNLFRKAFLAYTQQQNSLKQLQELEKQSRSDLDYCRFQYDELHKAALQPGEDTDLEAQLQMLQHAAEIRHNLEKSLFLLREHTEFSVEGGLSEILSLLRPLEKYRTEYQELLQRMQSVYIEIKDLSTEITALSEDIADDPQKAALLQARHDLLQRLLIKHNAANPAELIQIKEAFRERMERVETLEQDIEDLQKQIQSLRQDLSSQAAKISARRKEAIPALEKQINSLLAGLGMPNARFVASLKVQDELNTNGSDYIRFLFNANLGGEPDELAKVASGGELSRLMLAIKSVISIKNLLPTIIFDEIDTGVSGEIGYKMGSILETIAQNMQVISITHLPQIAAKGKKHFLVYKTTQNQYTQTRIKGLEPQERIHEVAKMLGGNSPSETILQSAKELFSKN